MIGGTHGAAIRAGAALVAGLDRMCRALALAVLLLGAGRVTPAAGEGIWMGDTAIRETFSGHTIDGTYSDGTPFTESYLANGRLAYSEVRRRLAGRWSVVEGTFCTLYDNAVPGGCFKIRRTGENCFEFYFAAVDEEDLAVGTTDPPRWVARGWRKDQPATCQTVPSS